MFLIEGDHVIQHLSATTPDPTLRDSVLPRTSDARANGLNPGRLQELEQITSEFGVTVEQHISVATWKRQSLPQLLHDQSLVGCAVALKCRIRRRSCSITSKQ